MEPVGGTFIVLATFCPVESKVPAQWGVQGPASEGCSEEVGVADGGWCEGGLLWVRGRLEGWVTKTKTSTHRKHASEDGGPEASLPGPLHPSTMRKAVRRGTRRRRLRYQSQERSQGCDQVTSPPPDSK